MRRVNSHVLLRAVEKLRVLVTGADGFIGQHLISHLLPAGHDITGAVLSDSPRRGTLSDSERAGVVWCGVDMRDSDRLQSLTRDVRPECVFHLAGISSRVEAQTAYAEALAVNSQGTFDLLWSLAEAGLADARVIVAGSADVYGMGVQSRISETAALHPSSAYGVSKAAQDVVARATSEVLELDVRVARFFPLVGPGQRDAFVLPSFCRRAFRIQRGGVDPTMRVGNLDVYRDFTDVRDGIVAMARLADLDQVRHRVYNVCRGKPTSVRQLLQWVFDIAGIAPEVVIDEELIRADEPEQVVGDPSRIEEEIGWKAELDLRRTVDDTFHWMTQSGAT
jgi:nucleoside-diphosphate-sugar epimerase